MKALRAVFIVATLSACSSMYVVSQTTASSAPIQSQTQPSAAPSYPAAPSVPAGTNVLPANMLIPSPTPSAPIADWTQADRRFPVEVVAEGGAHLRGWDFKPKELPSKDGRKNAPLVLFFNGNGMTIRGSEPLYRALADGVGAVGNGPVGAEVVVYDYRGYGFSEGKSDIMTFRRDALAIYDQLAKEYPTRPITVYGFSLGSAMATEVAAERHIGGLILAGSIASAASEFPVYAHARGYSMEQIAMLRPGQDAIEAFDDLGQMKRVTAPLLMLHGEQDTLVPIDQGRALFAAAQMKRKQFIPLPGAGHNQTASMPQAFAAVAAFLAER